MAKISLSSTFTPISEGKHIFKITNVEYKPDFGKLNITMETKNGDKHIERFSLIDSKGNPNNGGINAFSYFAKIALDDFTIQEIDHEDLVGRYIKCEVIHNKVPSTKKEGEFVTFVQLGDKVAVNSFSEDSSKQKSKQNNEVFDLDDLLGD